MNWFVETFAINIFIVLACVFWGWIAVVAWRAGWRPVIFILLHAGWVRLKFYLAWLRFRWRTRNDPPQSN